MKYTILAADDSKTCLEKIKSIFTHFSNELFLLTAKNGIEACKLALAHKPNLILMDLEMPEMNGIDAIRYLKNKPETKQIPIILLTASDSIEKAFKVGADDFILKPFKEFELLIRIKLALNLVDKIDKIEKQNKRLQQQNFEIEKQHKLLEEQKQEIIDDIRYSKRIQNAILPTKDFIESILNDYFIFNKPRNIVGGDFYWVDKKNDKTIVAVADCTGHGVSGAFLTMAGMAFLKEIINNYEFNSASDILEHLRSMVIKLLQQKGEEGETSDGLDIALCMIDPENNTIQYAGANNPIYQIKNNELFIHHADRMPIGIHINKTTPFTNNLINYKNNDLIYLFSDGFADQFGGEKNKKYRYKQFRQLFLDIHQEPIQKQKELIENSFENWKGNNFQVDDILILGIKL